MLELPWISSLDSMHACLQLLLALLSWIYQFFTAQYVVEIKFAVSISAAIPGIFMQARLSLFEEYYSSLEQSNLVLDDLPCLLDERLLCLRQRGSGLLLTSHGGGKVTSGHAHSCCLHLSLNFTSCRFQGILLRLVDQVPIEAWLDLLAERVSRRLQGAGWSAQ